MFLMNAVLHYPLQFANMAQITFSAVAKGTGYSCDYFARGNRELIQIIFWVGETKIYIKKMG
jgi:hypothetical protein